MITSKEEKKRTNENAGRALRFEGSVRRSSACWKCSVSRDRDGRISQGFHSLFLTNSWKSILESCVRERQTPYLSTPEHSGLDDLIQAIEANGANKESALSRQAKSVGYVARDSKPTVSRLLSPHAPWKSLVLLSHRSSSFGLVNYQERTDQIHSTWCFLVLVKKPNQCLSWFPSNMPLPALINHCHALGL